MTFVSENDLLTFLEDDNTTYDLFSSFGFDFEDTEEQYDESNENIQSCNPFVRLLQLEMNNPFLLAPEEMFGKKREAPFDELLKQEPPLKKTKYNNAPDVFDVSPMFEQDVVEDYPYEEEEDLCPSKYQPYRFSYGFPCEMRSTENRLSPHDLMNGEKMLSVIPTVKPSPACIYCRSIKKKCSSFPGNGRCDNCRKKDLIWYACLMIAGLRMYQTTLDILSIAILSHHMSIISMQSMEMKFKCVTNNKSKL